MHIGSGDASCARGTRTHAQRGRTVHSFPPSIGSATSLCFPARERRKLAGWARAEYPREACGVLIGARDASGLRVELALLARNLDAERARERYELDPGGLVRAEDEARARGLEVIGIWHSHPDRPAEPSETDRASAWQGWSYVIAAVAPEGVTALRSWRLANDVFLEEALSEGADRSVPFDGRAPGG